MDTVTSSPAAGGSGSISVWFLAFLFVEFSAPFNLFGEPVGLVLIELAILAVAVLAEAFVLAGIVERRRTAMASG